MEKKPHRYINLTSQIQSMYLFMAIATIIFTATLSPFIDVGAHEIQTYQDLVKEKIKWFIMPDRRQRIIYLTATLLLPLSILLTACLRSKRSLVSGKTSNPVIDGIFALIISFALISTFFNSTLFPIFLGRNFDEKFAIGAALVSATLVYSATTSKIAGKTIFTDEKLYYTIYIICLITQILSFRIFNNHVLTESSVWSESFDAVIYPLTEVHHGKTIIADLPSQYGLYPEFMAPLFRLFGLSILNISISFAVMQFAAMIFMGIFISKTINSFSIKYLISISLIGATFSSIGHYTGVDDAYFQYWPIRFFWPALITLQFYQFTVSRTTMKALAISISSTLATLWNADVGAVILTRQSNR